MNTWYKVRWIAALTGIILVSAWIIYWQVANPSNPKYTVINQSSAASPAGTFAQSVRTALDANWYQSENCTDAAKKFRETRPAIMVWNSSVAFAALNKKLEDCQLPTLTKFVMSADTYMDICHLPGKKKSLPRASIAGPVTLGMASMYAVDKHELQWEGQVKLVPYSGSKTVLQALRAGDIDWGWMGHGLAKKQGDKIVCPLSTKTDSPESLSNFFPGLTIPDFTIKVVVYTNGDERKVRDYLAKNMTFRHYLLSSGQVEDFDFTSADMNKVQDYVKKMYSTWGDSQKP